MAINTLGVPTAMYSHALNTRAHDLAAAVARLSPGAAPKKAPAKKAAVKKPAAKKAPAKKSRPAA
jgi:DNA topoisomerase-1